MTGKTEETGMMTTASLWQSFLRSVMNKTTDYASVYNHKLLSLVLGCFSLGHLSVQTLEVFQYPRCAAHASTFVPRTLKIPKRGSRVNEYNHRTYKIHQVHSFF